MLFNSFEFALFLPVVFLLYWFVFNRSLRAQNLFVVGASYLFYGWWDWRFLLLIAFTSLCSYASGLLIGRFRKRRGGERWSRAVNAGNILLNLTILGVFKYYDFFAASFAELFGIADYDSLLLQIILPVGISFYTFQALSYSIDVYREKLAPTRDIVAFFAFISFFPQLVAGPIERATNLLPQFLRPRTFDTAQAVDGLRQALWGFFKKIVVADNCAILANGIFDNYENLSGGALVIGAVAFSFQIYGDFSGYSDIAIGISRLFGFSLMRNFNYPYFSRDIAEFWRRWHISLTTWFRDYIYIPLGGSRGSKWMVFRNTLVIFLVSGFWHGANWTFIAWGAYHALLFLPLILSGRNRRYTGEIAAGRTLPTAREALQIASTFALAAVGWIIFRAETIGDAWRYVRRIFSPAILDRVALGGSYESPGIHAAVGVAILLAVEWSQRTRQHGLQLTGRAHISRRSVRYAIYYLLILGIYIMHAQQQTFIYFQF